MILARAGKYIVTVSAAIGAVSAQADVMEIDSNGARWVAGGTPAAAPALLEMTEAQRKALGVAIPDNIAVNPQLTALGVPARYAAKVQELSLRYDLSPSLIEALVWQESRWRENAVSPAGARGLAQLMPGTARYLGVDPDDPEANLEGGARYLREQLNTFDGDLEKALAAYNAGPGRVIRAGGIPNIRETRHYVAAILGRLANHARVAQQ
uniref:lytic transglycosylase domain-containing protein n=1 Tax=uncultured Erythrobacter sp. TaxID=263913 RepID=UPI002633F649|nr:lytic transglycosylase domain-containing protein [uncultured Erythrobacter sp.]